MRSKYFSSPFPKGYRPKSGLGNNTRTSSQSFEESCVGLHKKRLFSFCLFSEEESLDEFIEGYRIKNSDDFEDLSYKDIWIRYLNREADMACQKRGPSIHNGNLMATLSGTQISRFQLLNKLSRAVQTCSFSKSLFSNAPANHPAPVIEPMTKMKHHFFA